MLPTTKEVNELLPHYQAIQLKLCEWRERDDNSNAWLYDGARQDLSNAWKWIYRMGVRHQLLYPDPVEELPPEPKTTIDLMNALQEAMDKGKAAKERVYVTNDGGDEHDDPRSGLDDSIT